MAPDQERFAEAVSLFNERDFFACHDVLEEIWDTASAEDRDFYQGLIHVAVSLFHFTEGNLTGARKMYHSAHRYLAEYPSPYQSLDLDRLLSGYDHCFAELAAVTTGYPAHLSCDPERIPRMRLV